MILLIGGTKGGSGRSTIATNLAAWLAQEGIRFALLDADKQRTSAKWAARRMKLAQTGSEEVPPIFCPEKQGEGVASVAMELEQTYGLVIIDAGGRDSVELRYALGVADILVVPIMPSQFDLETLEELFPVVNQAKGLNPKLKTTVLLSKTEMGRGRDEFEEAREMLSGFPEFELSRNHISYLKVYRAAQSEGLGVVEMPRNKARAELQLLAQELFDDSEAK